MSVLVTDLNFEEQVLKASLPVVVDFHAEWCVAPETNVLLGDGSQIEASKIISGQQLPGLGASGVALGRVTKSQVAKDLGHCQEVVLNTGRKVKVTDQHLFYGPKGWVAVRDLKAGDKVAVLPSPDAVEEVADKRELVLARLAGLLFTDGTLYYQAKNRYWEVSFTLGQQKDVDDLIRDINDLGFDNVRIQEITKNQEISGRKFGVHIFKVKCLSKELFCLMKNSGVPVGAKKSQEYTVPGWIKNGNRAIKREFLRGFLGGDGPKVDILMVAQQKRLPYNKLSLNDLEFHKNSDLENSGLLLAKEISVLLNEFGVVVSKVFAEKDSYKRRDGQHSSIIHISFKKDFETALNLVSQIGYAYAWQKESRSQIVGEFLREIWQLRRKWQNLYKEVLRLAANGLGYRRVSRALGIRPLLAFNWIKGRTKARVSQHKLKFNQWLEDSLAGVPSGFIWEKIENVEPVFLPAVAKITVDRTNSFITNGILSHNCGPCKMMDPILEELEKEYAGKVVIGRLDVDANPATAGKYGVMSIPTLIFFKNGQVVKQMVGYQGKEAVVREISGLLNEN